MNTNIRKFKLGSIYITKGVQVNISSSEINSFIERHSNCDWGNVCSEDAKSNEDALKFGARLLSVYKTKSGEKVWVITEWNRRVTTVLFPEEY